MKKLIFLLMLSAVTFTKSNAQVLALSNLYNGSCEDVTVTFYAVDASCNLVGQTNPITLVSMASPIHFYHSGGTAIPWSTAPSGGVDWTWGYALVESPGTSVCSNVGSSSCTSGLTTSAYVGICSPATSTAECYNRYWGGAGCAVPTSCGTDGTRATFGTNSIYISSGFPDANVSVTDQ